MKPKHRNSTTNYFNSTLNYKFPHYSLTLANSSIPGIDLDASHTSYMDIYSAWYTPRSLGIVETCRDAQAARLTLRSRQSCIWTHTGVMYNELNPHTSCTFLKTDYWSIIINLGKNFTSSNYKIYIEGRPSQRFKQCTRNDGADKDHHDPSVRSTHFDQ